MHKFFGLAISFGLLLSSADATQECIGTVFVKKPDSWNKMYLLAGGDSAVTAEIPAALDSSGWYRFEISDYVQATYFVTPKFFFASDTGSGERRVITNALFNQASPAEIDSFSCASISRISQKFYVEEKSGAAGTTYSGEVYQNAKLLYVLPPQNDIWRNSVPVLHSPSIASDVKLTPATERCGWFKAMFPGTDVPSTVQIYRAADANDVYAGISLSGFASSDTLFYISGEVSPGTIASENGTCSFAQTMTFYDTDASLHGAFTCDGYPYVASNNCYDSTAKYNYAGSGAAQTVPCIGITRGIVASSLGPDGKPVYEEASGCFASPEAFNVIFNETEGINTRHERQLNFTRARNGNWEYNSENEKTGAFTPLNDLADSVSGGSCAGICKVAATPREGYGYAEYGRGDTSVSGAAASLFPGLRNWAKINPATGLLYIDSYPAGDGEFDSGENPNVYNEWSWEDRIMGENNQQFCMEYHAKFIAGKGQTLNVRGDDDIWVFIDKKLTVDLGGTHLSAPARIELDTLSLASGTIHSFDLFLCDRRTKMSNFYISTNIYLSQNTLDTSNAIKAQPRKKIQVSVVQTKSGLLVSGLQNESAALYRLNGEKIYSSAEVSGTAEIPVLRKGVYLVRVGTASYPVVFR